MIRNRPELTWRDIQHLCVTTAVQVNPDDPDWDRTAVGRPYSYKYGYGLLDAWRFVNAAITWELVKPQAWVDLPLLELGDGKVDEKNNMLGGLRIPPEGISSKMTITSDILVENNIESIEHITVKIWVNHTKRGDVQVDLSSPQGVVSMLGGARSRDTSTSGYLGWTFMTIKHWYILHLLVLIKNNHHEHEQGRITCRGMDLNSLRSKTEIPGRFSTGMDNVTVRFFD